MDSPNHHADAESRNDISTAHPTVKRRRRRIRVRRSWLKRHYRLALAGLVALTLTGTIWYGEQTRRLEKTARSTGDALSVPVVPAVLDNDREYYPYSVIPGGIRSVEELREAIKRDPVVARHYADFNLERARVERVREPRLVHVSYRIGQKVFWTSRLMHVRAGETIVTDGVNCARGRCGNRMSDTHGKTFVPPVSELAEENFDTPAFGAPPTIVSLLPEPVLTSMPILPAPVISAIMPEVVETPTEWAPAPRHIFTPTLTGPGTPGNFVIRPTAFPTDTAVPEPGTFLVGGLGLAALIAGRKLLPGRA